MNLFYAYPVEEKGIVHCDIGSMPDVTYPSGYFDVVAASNIGGAGIIIYISSSHFFHVKMGYDKSTNTMAELMALWELMFFVASIGIPTLSVFGESKVIINWENSVANLVVVDLEH